MTLSNKIFSSRILKTLLVLLSATLLITCDQMIPTPSTSDDPAPTYTVTYNANNADSGSVPTDSNNYEEGQTVTTKTNSGSLTRSGYTFNGWNTAADGSGTSYATEATFSMGTANVTLYARWTAFTYSTLLGADIDGEAASDQTGFSVSLSSDGSIVAIGALYNDGTASNAGHVRVYQYASGSWSQLGGDIDGEASGDLSGYSVSLSNDGSTVAIGAKYNDGTASNAGHVRVYQYASGSWSQLGADIDGEAADDNSGYSVSLSSDGSIVAIGALYNDGTASNAGHVRVYQYASGSWSQLGGDIDGEAASDQSGYAVSLSSDGTIVAIGAILNGVGVLTSAGHVRVYQYASGSWSKLGADIDGEAAHDRSGYSVSLSSDGSIVAIGSYANDGTATNAGHVRVYQYASGSWSKLGADIDGEAAYDESGYSVSLSSDGSIVAIGALYNDGTGTDAGHVRVYQYASGSWSKLGGDIDGEAAGDNSGYAVSLSSNGSTVAIGARYNDGTASNAGHVRVYD